MIVANAHIGQARAYFFPTLSITGQGGTNVACLDAAESRHEQMLESYQQTIRHAFRKVAGLLGSIRERSEQLNRQRE